MQEIRRDRLSNFLSLRTEQMAVSTTGDVYSWGRTTGGRIGLKHVDEMVSSPQKVSVKNSNNEHVKAVDVECGYVHSMIVGCDGSVFMCGGVGVDGEEDGQNASTLMEGQTLGKNLLEDYLYHQCDA